jgi:hypothetical protein
MYRGKPNVELRLVILEQSPIENRKGDAPQPLLESEAVAAGRSETGGDYHVWWEAIVIMD